MKFIIIDDEPKAIAVLERYGLKIPFLECRGTFRDGLSAIQFLHQNSVDLVFLDINIPEIDGLTVAKIIEGSTLVIFTTAYSEHAVESYEIDVVDYLLKPFEFERYVKAVNMAHKQFTIRKEVIHKKLGFSEQVLLKSGSVTHKVPIKEILFLKKDGNYIEVQTLKKRILIRANMNEVFSIVPEDRFIRLYKSFVVALEAIETVESHQVSMRNFKIPIGAKYREELIERLNAK